MLPAGLLKELIVVLTDYISVIVKDNSGKKCEEKKNNNNHETNHGTFVFLQALPGLCKHTSLSEVRIFHTAPPY